jgi:hypothetical protein
MLVLLLNELEAQETTTPLPTFITGLPAVLNRVKFSPKYEKYDNDDLFPMELHGE